MLPSAPGRGGLRDTLVNVSGGSHARPTGSGDPVPRRRLRWRLGTPLVVLACGGLFVVSATNSQGTDLRPGRYTDLASLVDDEADSYAELSDKVAALDAQVTMLSTQVDDGEVKR